MNMNGGEFLPSGVLSFQLMLEGGLKTFSSTYTDPPQPAGFPSLQRMPLVSWGAACVWVRMHVCVCVYVRNESCSGNWCASVSSCFWRRLRRKPNRFPENPVGFWAEDFLWLGLYICPTVTKVPFEQGNIPASSIPGHVSFFPLGIPMWQELWFVVIWDCNHPTV